MSVRDFDSPVVEVVGTQRSYAKLNGGKMNLRGSWWVVFALAVVLGACADSDSQAATVPIEEVLADLSSTFQGAEFDEDAEVLLAEFAAVEEGVHRILTLGTEISLTTSEPLRSQFNGVGAFVLTDPGSTEPPDRDIFFLRVSEFSDPTQLSLPRDEQVAWPKEDFVGWLANLPEELVATEAEEVMIGGADALFVELSIGDTECGYAPGACLGFAENESDIFLALAAGARYRVWYVPQGNEDPLVIAAGIDDDADAEWFGRAEQILSTLAFGETAPNPLFATGTDAVNVSTFGGARLTFPRSIAFGELWVDRGLWVAPLDEDFRSQIDFLNTPLSRDGERIGDLDELISMLDRPLELTEVESANVGGIEARVFDYTVDTDVILLRAHEFDVRDPQTLGWRTGRAGRIWVIDHPERGVQMIGVKVVDAGAEELLAEAISFTNEVLSNFEYVELG